MSTFFSVILWDPNKFPFQTLSLIHHFKLLIIYGELEIA